MDSNNFLHFDAPRDAEGKRFSAEQMYRDVEPIVQPLGITTKFIKKSNLLTLVLLGCGGDLCTVDQIKAALVWGCVIFAIDDLFDGERSKDNKALQALAEAMKPKYENGTKLPAELDALITEKNRAVLRTVSEIRRTVMHPMVSHRQEFDDSLDEYMEGVLNELRGDDVTTDESEYLRIRRLTIALRGFIVLAWDFQGVSTEDISVVQRATVLCEYIVAVDNDIVSHDKTVRERGGDVVSDFATVHGSISAACIARDELYAEFQTEIALSSARNRALTALCDWVVAGFLFHASSRRYMASPLAVREFFAADVADWMVAEGLIAA